MLRGRRRIGVDEYGFTPWVTPLLARLYEGPFPVGGVMVFGPSEEACRVGRSVALEVFYGLEDVREGKLD